MKNSSKVVALICVLFGAFIISSSFVITNSDDEQFSKSPFKFPFKKAGLSEKQAAAHLLSRFTFGAKPGEVEEVVKMGLDKWFEKQLAANEPNDSLDALLEPYSTLKMDNNAIAEVYPRNNARIYRMAIKDGYITKDSGQFEKKEYKEQFEAYMKLKGLKKSNELFRELINQKIVRAAYSNNQLQEVLTSFWFNHFNVSLTKNESGHFTTVYERATIRPNVLGNFENLLVATAKSPAMLTYLDNFRSVASTGSNNEAGSQALRNIYAQQMVMKQNGDTSSAKYKEVLNKIKGARNAQGLNENYAREIMELHTLGVDGGYTQTDVTNAAKVLTGWTIYPTENNYGDGGMIKLIKKLGYEKFISLGNVHDSDFLFLMNRHDKTEKTVLGNKFEANGGYNEGIKLLNILAHHPSTARFISKKLAVHFVCDNPPKSLLDKMSKTFLEKDGDIKQVLITMVNAPEFWSKEALREKIKSPFELAISTVRALDAKVAQPYQLYNWITKMGERYYYYQAPTGFPDKAQYWINTGSLLNRMNFGLALSSKRIPGITFNLTALNNNHEPESAAAALITYSKLLLPERNIDETVKRLTPFLNDPALVAKIDAAAGKAPVAHPETHEAPQNNMSDDMMGTNYKDKDSKKVLGEALSKKIAKKSAPSFTTQQLQVNTGTNSILSQVTGIIIGSPEFQRK